MTKLIDALTNLALAATAYLERETHPMLPLAAAAAAGADAPAPKKEKKAKAPAAEKVHLDIKAIGDAIAQQNHTSPEFKAPAPAPAPAPIGNPDPLADLMGSTPQAAAPAPVPQAPALTPEQSILEMKKAAFGVVKAFPAVTANGAGGAPSTEGEDKLRALLAGTFRVAKLMDLTHENRLAFINMANTIVAGAK